RSLVFTTCCFPLFSPHPGQLTVLPQEPLVEVGGSIQLNCSLDCPNGKVQWKGLDTSLGNILSTPSYSLLSVTHATVAMGGTQTCTGHCQGSSFQKKVDLQVYALPDTLQLETQPRALVAGEAGPSKVYPPSSLTLSWYQGDQRLHGTETEEESDEEELFSYHSELEVPGEKVTEGSAFRCEVALLPPGAERPFQRRAPLRSSRSPPTSPVSKPPLTTAWRPPRPSPPSPAPPRSAPAPPPGAAALTPAATGSPWPEQTTGGRSPGTASVCSLRIRPDPPEGTTGEALKITCEAECAVSV
uniref:Mucosal vascular addressin cell adhesion molecule 1 n=1 Tax=Pelodiscus sinensis TaxID=13735 RepID=K7F6L1_PELSI